MGHRAEEELCVVALELFDVGYADGWLRSLGNRGHVAFFAGRQLAILGRVSMDTVTVDLSGVPDNALVPGAHFDLIDATHDVNAVAAEAGTNAYEILTSLGSRYSRIYIR